MNCGISFFPHYVVPDDSIRFVHIQFGIVGYGIIFKLYERIYSQSFYSDWNKDICVLFASDCLLTPEKVQTVVDYAVEKGVFDSRLYKEFGILTSARIQKDYFFAAKCKPELCIKEEYLLISLDDIFKDAQSSNTNVPGKVTKSEKADLFSQFTVARENDMCEEFVANNSIFRPWLEQFDYNVIIYALTLCIRKERKNVDYLFGILGNWKKNGFTSLDDVDDPILSVPEFLNGAPEYLVDIHRDF